MYSRLFKPVPIKIKVIDNPTDPIEKVTGGSNNLLNQTKNSSNDVVESHSKPILRPKTSFSFERVGDMRDRRPTTGSFKRTKKTNKYETGRQAEAKIPRLSFDNIEISNCLFEDRHLYTQRYKTPQTRFRRDSQTNGPILNKFIKLPEKIPWSNGTSLPDLNMTLMDMDNTINKFRIDRTHDKITIEPKLQRMKIHEKNHCDLYLRGRIRANTSGPVVNFDTIEREAVKMKQAKDIVAIRKDKKILATKDASLRWNVSTQYYESDGGAMNRDQNKSQEAFQKSFHSIYYRQQSHDKIHQFQPLPLETTDI